MSKSFTTALINKPFTCVDILDANIMLTIWAEEDVELLFQSCFGISTTPYQNAHLGSWSLRLTLDQRKQQPTTTFFQRAVAARLSSP